MRMRVINNWHTCVCFKRMMSIKMGELLCDIIIARGMATQMLLSLTRVNHGSAAQAILGVSIICHLCQHQSSSTRVLYLDRRV